MVHSYTWNGDVTCLECYVPSSRRHSDPPSGPAVPLSSTPVRRSQGRGYSAKKETLLTSFPSPFYVQNGGKQKENPYLTFMDTGYLSHLKLGPEKYGFRLSEMNVVGCYYCSG